jgi:hypothetical protein
MTSDDAERSKPRAAPAPDADVPRLPRGRGLRLSRPLLVRIAGTVALLVFLIAMQRPCADSVSRFVTGFGSSGDHGSAAAVMPRPGTIDVPGSSGGSMGSAGSGSAGSGSAGPGSAGSGSAGAAAGPDALDLERYEHLRPGMTDDEVKAVIERARAKAAGSSAPR